MTQLRDLATPFKGGLVKAPPRGKFGSYVSHSTVNERALSVVGPHSFEIIEVVRGWADTVVVNKGKDTERTFPAREAVVGCLARLTAHIDGQTVSVVEAGDVEGAAGQEDGANLKEASSDAYKRCWMRLGLGLHLWSQDDYFLDRQLDKNAAEAQREIIEQRDGGGAVVGRYYADTGEPVPLPGQETLEYSDDDPERPFE